MVSLWFIAVDADDICLWALGPEVPDNHPQNRSKDDAANFSGNGGARWTYSWRSSTVPSV